MDTKIEITNSKEILSCKIFNVVEDTLLFDDGRQFKRLAVMHPGAVVIIPQCEDGSLLMVRQYRHPARKDLLEFPAGTLEENESVLNCAKREVCEEVGQAAKDWTSLGALYPAPGYCSELLHGFLARELSPEKAEGDEDEVIEIIRMSVDELEKAISQGEIEDAKTLAFFYKARLLGVM